MAFDSAVATTWGEALADVRDKVGGMASWSIKDDSSAGAASLAQGDWFVLSTATGEDIRIEVMNNGQYGFGGVRGEYGPNWDATNDTWADKYPQDPYGKYDGGTDRYSIQSEIAPLDSADNRNSLGMADTGTYWLSYADATGFCFYFERTQGDGYDGDVAFGWSQLSQTWDYDTADKREADYAYLWSGARHQEQDYDTYYGTDIDAYSVMAQSGNSNNTGFGQVNPDANYANYPLTDTYCTSSSYRNTAGNDTIIGTHDLFIEDRSGGDSAHRDTVQDGGGTNLYTILKATRRNLALKML